MSFVTDQHCLPSDLWNSDVRFDFREKPRWKPEKPFHRDGQYCYSFKLDPSLQLNITFWNIRVSYSSPARPCSGAFIGVHNKHPSRKDRSSLFLKICGFYPEVTAYSKTSTVLVEFIEKSLQYVKASLNYTIIDKSLLSSESVLDTNWHVARNPNWCVHIQPSQLTLMVYKIQAKHFQLVNLDIWGLGPEAVEVFDAPGAQYSKILHPTSKTPNRIQYSTTGFQTFTFVYKHKSNRRFKLAFRGTTKSPIKKIKVSKIPNQLNVSSICSGATDCILWLDTSGDHGVNVTVESLFYKGMPNQDCSFSGLAVYDRQMGPNMHIKTVCAKGYIERELKRDCFQHNGTFAVQITVLHSVWQRYPDPSEHISVVSESSHMTVVFYSYQSFGLMQMEITAQSSRCIVKHLNLCRRNSVQLLFDPLVGSNCLLFSMIASESWPLGLGSKKHCRIYFYIASFTKERRKQMFLSLSGTLAGWLLVEPDMMVLHHNPGKMFSLCHLLGKCFAFVFITGSSTVEMPNIIIPLKCVRMMLVGGQHKQIPCWCIRNTIVSPLCSQRGKQNIHHDAIRFHANEKYFSSPSKRMLFVRLDVSSASDVTLLVINKEPESDMLSQVFLDHGSEVIALTDLAQMTGGYKISTQYASILLPTETCFLGFHLAKSEPQGEVSFCFSIWEHGNSSCMKFTCLFRENNSMLLFQVQLNSHITMFSLFHHTIPWIIKKTSVARFTLSNLIPSFVLSLLDCKENPTIFLENRRELNNSVVDVLWLPPEKRRMRQAGTRRTHVNHTDCLLLTNTSFKFSECLIVVDVDGKKHWSEYHDRFHFHVCLTETHHMSHQSEISWLQASQLCQSVGGHLPIFRSKRESQDLVSLKLDAVEFMFVGMHLKVSMSQRKSLPSPQMPSD